MKIRSSLFFAVLCTTVTSAYGQQPNECRKIIEDTERLACYDQQFIEPTFEQAIEQEIEAPLITGNVVRSEPESQYEQHVKRDRTKKLSTYRPNYFLFYSYNFNRDTSLYPESDISYELDRAEAKFQISFKGPIWLNILDSKFDLWFGYTQVSFWQWFNTDLSSPFRESNYEPEAWIEYDANYELYDGWKLRTVTVGGNHQSNGQEKLLSRSWNRLMTSVDFQKEFGKDQHLRINVRTWKRISEEFDDDDNPDITRFMGHAEFTAIYKHQRHEVSLMFRNVASTRNSVNLNWSFPVNNSPYVKGYIQLFNGYGESLIDYNHYNQSIGIGFSISDWL